MTDSETATRTPDPLPPRGGRLTLMFVTVIVFGVGIGLVVRSAFTNAEELREAQTLPETLAALPTGPMTGLPAPDLTLELLDFRTFSLDRHLAQDGRPVVLNFWAPSCPPCREETPEFIEVSNATPEVLFVGVGTPTIQFPDTKEDAIAFVEEFDVPYPIGWDETETVATAYGITRLPQTWIIGSDGTIVRVFIGAVRAAWLEALLEQDLGISAEG